MENEIKDDKLALVKEAVAKVVSEELSLEQAASEYQIDEAILSAFLEEVQGEKLKDGETKAGFDDGSEVDLDPKVDGADELKKGSGGNTQKANVKEEAEVKVPQELATKVTKADIAVDVKEHLDAFFKGEEISEEFKGKMKDIFESAVIATSQKIITANVAKLEENNALVIETARAELEAANEEHKATINEKVDEYLSYVVEEWVQENKPAVQSTIRSDLSESFILGLKGLFEEHYIDIPAEKTNVVEEFATKLQESENEVEKLIQENIALKQEKDKILKESIVDKVSHGLSENQKDKFSALTENVEFTDFENFEKSLATIRESYFEDDTTTVTSVENDDTEIEGLEESVTTVAEDKTSNPTSAYLAVMKNMVRTR